MVSSHWVQIATRLGRTAGAEVAALTGEREPVFVCTVVAADAGEAVLKHAAGEELVRDLRDDGPPRAVLARETVVIDRLQAILKVKAMVHSTGGAKHTGTTTIRS